MELKLRSRRPKWWEKKWKPKKPILYILEFLEGKWVNTYWWSGNWGRENVVKFSNSGTVKTGLLSGDRIWLVVGRSGTTLTVEENILGNRKIKSLHPKVADWTCFGVINGIGNFTEKVSEFNLEEKIKESYR